MIDELGSWYAIFKIFTQTCLGARPSVDVGRRPVSGVLVVAGTGKQPSVPFRKSFHE